MIIDQHALHERILYEQLREKVLAGAMETQRLLVPEPVDLTPAEAAAALAAREVLAQLGIEIEPFGGDTVLVSALSRRCWPISIRRGAAAVDRPVARPAAGAGARGTCWTSCCT